MSVTEIKQALGSWSLSLNERTPREILDAITPFGHIALLPGKVDVLQAGDGLLAAARYVGVYRGRESSDNYTLTGAGNEFWLGDEDGKGPVLTTPVVSASATFANAIRALIPAAVYEGTLVAIPGGGTWTNTAQYQTAREAITYVTDSYSTSTFPVSWRINGDWTLDAGRDVDLFVTTPRAILVRKRGGRDLDIVGLKGTLELDTDVVDYTTKVVLLAEGEGNSTVTASASVVSPYKDPKGNAVVITRLVSEFETDSANAAARAQLQLNRFTNPRFAVSLSTEDYDVKGTFKVGDSIMVHDPAIGFVDPAREVFWRGQPINPLAMRVTELTWPIPADWTVAFRDGLGVWTDLSRYYAPEGGSTTVVVGDVSAALNSVSTQPIGSRPVADTSTPATPVLLTSNSSTYQTANGNGETRAQVQLTWSQPLNVDGSTVLDGAFYTIRWRPNVSAPYPATWSQASGFTWSAVSGNAWQQPLVTPILSTAWMQTVVPWGINQILIQELTPGVTYEFQIMAADTASPANQSPFSSSTAIAAAIDFFPPSPPAAPEVAGNTISIQVTHRLGRASGGTFNLDADLDHLEIHVGGDTSFFPDESTKVGKLVANAGLIRAGIPAVGTFNIEQTGPVYVKVVAVDKTGNKSTASAAAAVTAILVNDAHISDLTVTKVTAGTIQATWINAGEITTAPSGQRATMNASGFHAFNAAGLETFTADSSGFVQVLGTLTSDTQGKRIVVNPSDATVPTIRFYPSVGSDFAAIYSPDITVTGESEAWIAIRSSFNASDLAGGALLSPGSARIGTIQNGTNRIVGGGTYVDANQNRTGHFSSSESVVSGLFAYSGYTEVGIRDADVQMRSGMYAQGTDFASLGLFDTDGVQQVGLYLDNFNGGLNSIYGKFLNNGSFAAPGTAAVITGSPTFGSGTVSCVVAYGTTMPTTPWPAIGVFNGAAVGDYRMTSIATTGFTTTLTTSTGTSRINYWAFRIGA